MTHLVHSWYLDIGSVYTLACASNQPPPSALCCHCELVCSQASEEPQLLSPVTILPSQGKVIKFCKTDKKAVFGSCSLAWWLP